MIKSIIIKKMLREKDKHQYITEVILEYSGMYINIDNISKPSIRVSVIDSLGIDYLFNKEVENIDDISTSPDEVIIYYTPKEVKE